MRNAVSKASPDSANTSRSTGPASARTPSTSRDTVASVTDSDAKGDRSSFGGGPFDSGRRYDRLTSLPSRMTTRAFGASISMSPASSRPARSENRRGVTVMRRTVSAGDPPSVASTRRFSSTSSRGTRSMRTWYCAWTPTRRWMRASVSTEARCRTSSVRNSKPSTTGSAPMTASTPQRARATTRPGSKRVRDRRRGGLLDRSILDVQA